MLFVLLDLELSTDIPCYLYTYISDCKSFKDKIEEITESMAKAPGDSEEGTAAANLIEKLSVESKDTEEKQEAEDAPVSSQDKKDETEQQEKIGSEK